LERKSSYKCARQGENVYKRILARKPATSMHKYNLLNHQIHKQNGKGNVLCELIFDIVGNFVMLNNRNSKINKGKENIKGKDQVKSGGGLRERAWGTGREDGAGRSVDGNPGGVQPRPVEYFKKGGLIYKKSPRATMS